MLVQSVNPECFCNILFRVQMPMAERLRRALPEKNPPQVRTGSLGAFNLWAEQAEQIYFLYQKIASATKATVMIHRTMSLLRFFSFSSAIAESTPHLKATFKCCLDFLGI